MTLNDGVSIKHKTGIDADLIGGYDFGMFRLEAETGYKHASINSVSLNESYFGVPRADAGGHTSALSAMANGLLDFGNDAGLSGYVGGGLGVARVTYNLDIPSLGTGFRDRDKAFAWQLIAGVRMAVSDQFEVGLKYRYFQTGHLNFASDGSGIPGGVPFERERPLAFALSAAEPHLQRDSAAASAPAATSTAAASAAASGDADLPGRLGDPGDRYVPGSAATAATATAPSRTGRARLIRAAASNRGWASARPFFVAA